MEIDVVDLAYQIIDMDDTIRRQRREIEHLKDYKESYFELSNQNSKHTNEMIGIVFKGLLNKTISPMQEVL